MRHRIGWRAVALGVVGASLLVGCNKITRITGSTYQDSVRCMLQTMSGDGKWVVYSTMGDPSGIRTDQQTLLEEVATGKVTKVAGLNSFAGTRTAITADGSKVVLSISVRTGDSAVKQTYLWSRATATKVLVSPAGADTFDAAISADGRKIAYSSYPDLWIYDVASKQRTKVALPSGLGADDYPNAASLSATGRYLTFRAGDHGLYVRDLSTGSTASLVGSSDEIGGSDTVFPVSRDGRFVAFDMRRSGTAGNRFQVYLWDRTTGTSTRLTNVGVPVQAGGAAVSADGKRVVYLTYDYGTRGSTAIVRDRAAGTTSVMLTANRPVHDPSLSTGGHAAAFCTAATDLVKGSPEAPNIYTWSDN